MENKKIDFYLMKQKDIKIIKEKIWLQNNKKCPILKLEFPLENMVLDHIHKLKNEEHNINKGTIRTALHNSANALAGKIENNFKRYFGKNPPISLPEFLRNTADYLENEPYFEEENDTRIYFVHPNEVPKRKKLGKRDLNKINKYYLKLYPNRKKIPQYVYHTEEVKKLLEKINNINKLNKDKNENINIK